MLGILTFMRAVFPCQLLGQLTWRGYKGIITSRFLGFLVHITCMGKGVGSWTNMASLPIGAGSTCLGLVALREDPGKHFLG